MSEGASVLVVALALMPFAGFVIWGAWKSAMRLEETISPATYRTTEKQAPADSGDVVHAGRIKVMSTINLIVSSFGAITAFVYGTELRSLSLVIVFFAAVNCWQEHSQRGES